MASQTARKWLLILLTVVLAAGPAMQTAAASVPAGGEEGPVLQMPAPADGNPLYEYLKAEYGEERAAALYETLWNLRLIDEQGNPLKYPILLDGKTYSWEEMQQLLEDESTDLARVAEVDGQPVPLSVLKQDL